MAGAVNLHGRSGVKHDRGLQSIDRCGQQRRGETLWRTTTGGGRASLGALPGVALVGINRHWVIRSGDAVTASIVTTRGGQDRQGAARGRAGLAGQRTVAGRSADARLIDRNVVGQAELR